MGARFLTNLADQAALTPDQRQAVERLLGAPRPVPPETELVVDGDASPDCHVLLDGQAFRHKTLPDGRRQILGFAVPGDLIDLSRITPGADYSVTSLTACKVAPISRVRLDKLLNAQPEIARAFWSLSLAESAIQREWMVGMGRRTAHARVAHLLCEVFMRLRSVGLTQGARCRFPVTQTHLADAVGLSGVHMNRVLQSLRADAMITFRARELIILNWVGLAAVGEFDPGYLRLPGDLAAKVTTIKG